MRTIAGIKAGVVNPPKPNATFTKANGYVSDAKGNPILVNGHKVRVQAPTEKKSTIKPAPASIQNQYPYLVGYDSNGNIVALRGPNGNPVPYKPKPTKAGGKVVVSVPLSEHNHYLTDTSGNPILKNGHKQPYKTSGTGASTASARVAHNAYGAAVSQATGTARKLKGASVKDPAALSGYSPKYTKAQVRAQVWAQYHTKFANALRQLIATGQTTKMTKDEFRNTWESWITQVVDNVYR